MSQESKPPVTFRVVARVRGRVRRFVGDILAVIALGAVMALLWWFGP